MKKSALQFATLFLLMASPLIGQETSLEVPQEIPAKIDALIKRSYQANPQVGISVGFIHNDQEYYTAYGKLNDSSQININKNSVFEIVSITKVLTAHLIAQAAVEGKIELEDPIDPYLPSGYQLHQNLRNKIKISDLASHQSGLPDLNFRQLIADDPQQPTNSVTKESLYEMINNCEQLIDYGQYRYSTMGYTLLGQILEGLYKKPYDQIIQEKLIDPLQLTNTLTRDFEVTNRTTGKNPAGGHQEFFRWNVTAPAGLIKSSASDMITILKALLGPAGKFVQAAKLSEAVYYQDERRKMGLGVNIIPDGDNTLYLKSGDSMGQSSMICYNRAKNWGIIILLTQRNSSLREQLLNEIYETILK